MKNEEKKIEHAFQIIIFPGASSVNYLYNLTDRPESWSECGKQQSIMGK
jgi:hypothetical protein